MRYVPDGSLCAASTEQIFPRDSVQRNCFELALYTTRDHDCISKRIGRVFDPRCRCRLVTFAALPTPSMIERAIILLTDQRFWGHASGPSSSGKTLPCSIHCWHGHAARRSALPRERFRPLALNRSGGSGERPLCTKTGRISEGVSQLERDVGRLANVSLGVACTLRSDGTRISTASDDRDS